MIERRFVGNSELDHYLSHSQADVGKFNDDVDGAFPKIKGLADWTETEVGNAPSWDGL